jgi:hypothetical protein
MRYSAFHTELCFVTAHIQPEHETLVMGKEQNYRLVVLITLQELIVQI